MTAICSIDLAHNKKSENVKLKVIWETPLEGRKGAWSRSTSSIFIINKLTFH